MKTKPTIAEIDAARLVLRRLGGINSAKGMTAAQRKSRARKAGLAGKGISRKRKAKMKQIVTVLALVSFRRKVGTVSRQTTRRAKMNITANERKALQAIVDSEYQDGDPVGHDVWTQYCNPFSNKKTQGGVYASLSKKGLIRVGGDYDMGTGNGKMGTVCITQAGFDAIQVKQVA